jgi:hypothetical protein
MKIQTTIFWFMTPFSTVGGNQCFNVAYCLHHQGRLWNMKTACSSTISVPNYQPNTADNLKNFTLHMNRTQRNSIVGSTFPQLIQQFRTWIYKYSGMWYVSGWETLMLIMLCHIPDNLNLLQNCCETPCLKSKNLSIYRSTDLSKYYINITNLIHFHFHNHFIVSWSSTCFGR